MANLCFKPDLHIQSLWRASLWIALFPALSCSRSDADIQQEITGDTITFSIGIGDYTRAVSTFGPINLNALHSSTDGFAVCTSGLGSSSEMNNVAVTYNTSTRLWGYTGNYYWPSAAAQNVSFTAYAPAGTTGVTFTSAGLSISAFTPASTPASQIDLIYAAPANFNRRGSGTGGVVLTFTHLLTQVLFAVVTDIPSSSSPVINSVQLYVPHARGSYNGTSWNTTANPGTYTLFSKNAIGSVPIISTPLLLVPCGSIVKNTYVVINFTANGTIYSRLYDLSTLTNVTTWDQGKKITYTIQIKQADLHADTRSGAGPNMIEITATEREY